MQPYGESATTTRPFRYTGQRIDPETNGLYYYRARIYSPTLGRFLQIDPIGTRGGVNLYAYVGNDPLNAADPDGLVASRAGRLDREDQSNRQDHDEPKPACSLDDRELAPGAFVPSKPTSSERPKPVVWLKGTS